MTGFREPIQGDVPYYLDLQVKERNIQSLILFSKTIKAYLA